MRAAVAAAAVVVVVFCTAADILIKENINNQNKTNRILCIIAHICLQCT